MKQSISPNPFALLKGQHWSGLKSTLSKNFPVQIVAQCSRQYQDVIFVWAKGLRQVFRNWWFVTTKTTVTAFVKTSWWLHDNKRSVSWQHLRPSVRWNSLLPVLFSLLHPSCWLSSKCIQGVFSRCKLCSMEVVLDLWNHTVQIADLVRCLETPCRSPDDCWRMWSSNLRLVFEGVYNVSNNSVKF